MRAFRSQCIGNSCKPSISRILVKAKSFFIYIMKVLILLSLFVLATSARNIPVPGSYGRTMYVDPEELLEEALEFKLRRLGVYDVDVESSWLSRNEFSVTLLTSRNVGPNFEDSVEDVIHTELGLSDVTVTTRSPSWHRYRLQLTFNERTMEQELQDLYASLGRVLRVDIEYSPYDD